MNPFVTKVTAHSFVTILNFKLTNSTRIAHSGAWIWGHITTNQQKYHNVARNPIVQFKEHHTSQVRMIHKEWLVSQTKRIIAITPITVQNNRKFSNKILIDNKTTAAKYNTTAMVMRLPIDAKRQ